MKLGRAINKIWKKYVTDESHLNEGGVILVRKKLRVDAKARYLAYRCREFVREYLNQTEGFL